jgi:hypothetical protein
MCIESLTSALASVARVPGECCHMPARAGSFSRSQVPPPAQLLALGARVKAWAPTTRLSGVTNRS